MKASTGVWALFVTCFMVSIGSIGLVIWLIIEIIKWLQRN